MNDRRRFVRNFGILGAILGGVSSVSAAGKGATSGVGGVAITPSASNSPSIDHLKPVGTTNLQLHADNNPPKPSYTQTGYTVNLGTGHQSYVVTTQPTLEEQNRVKLSVGKDNRLWIEVDGEWRRVALEG